MNQATPLTHHLKDYTPPPFLVDRVALDVYIETGRALIQSRLECRRNPTAISSDVFVLDGEELETLAVKLNGKLLPEGEYELSATALTLSQLPDSFVLEITTAIDPDHNTQLSGLFKSRSGYFTQCEPQGFRRITWYPDRPDVMAVFTVTVHAQQEQFPVLLSNGNPVARGESSKGGHWVKWEDPHPKPSYLFALVAARLDELTGEFVTQSGRLVKLAFYTEPGSINQTPHALEALKKSMRWDEERFGLECDLDHYAVVAVGDFNMGAMENKGLNIFNAKYVLASADRATDQDYINIDRVIAHEYFHNWTGNRVTCRDWFQLSLKEGLTVFRDQEFGFDLHDQSISRIVEVRGLRSSQFMEDSGPMAHPVRPASYMEINNFYTATVYEKGAELVRMVQTLLGREGFRRGMDEYFRRHDGQAVTCEDFILAMNQASPFNHQRFMNWYLEPGTPHLQVRTQFDAAAQSYRIEVEQHNPRSSTGEPVLIPLRVALFNAQGTLIPDTEKTLVITESKQSFEFKGISSKPVVSLLRDFSAPVILEHAWTTEDLIFLLEHETDPFAAWEAGQRSATQILLQEYGKPGRGLNSAQAELYVAACSKVLSDHASRGAGFVTEVLSLPDEATLAESLESYDPEALHQSREQLRLKLAQALEPQLLEIYHQIEVTGPYQPDSLSMAKRSLRNLALVYLQLLNNPRYRELALTQFQQAQNMTDQWGALQALNQVDSPEREQALAEFFNRWQQDDLVVDKWFAIQSASTLPQTLERVRALSAHPAFLPLNPNRNYALIRTLGGNPSVFHRADGLGYEFMAEQVLRLDPHNPQVACRLLRTLEHWKKLEPGRRQKCREVLQYLHRHPGLSKGAFEIVNRALAGEA
jgi:aminopeptidase N